MNKKSGVFEPTGTSKILLTEALKKSRGKKNILDLGCGSGFIGISILERYKSKNLYFSDISKNAVLETLKNLKKKNLSAKELKIGSNLDCWKNYKFDLIICDVAAVSTKLEGISDWYSNNVPNDSGIDGTKNLINVIKKSKKFLTSDGSIILTVISLSNIKKIEKGIYTYFNNVKILKSQKWPFPNKFYKKIEELIKYKKKNLINFNEIIKGFYYFETVIYIASNDK